MHIIRIYTYARTGQICVISRPLNGECLGLYNMYMFNGNDFAWAVPLVFYDSMVCCIHTAQIHPIWPLYRNAYGNWPPSPHIGARTHTHTPATINIISIWWTKCGSESRKYIQKTQIMAWACVGVFGMHLFALVYQVGLYVPHSFPTLSICTKQTVMHCS